MAARHGNLDEVTFLVQVGADVNIKDKDGVSMRRVLSPGAEWVQIQQFSHSIAQINTLPLAHVRIVQTETDFKYT